MTLKNLIDSVDLEQLFERSVGQPVARGRWLIYHCPCHDDHHPSLAIDPQRRRWHCFGRCNTHGDALDWLQKQYGLPFVAARDELRRLSLHAPLSSASVTPRMHAPGPVLDEPPSPEWQQSAEAVVEQSTALFWSRAGVRARSWLLRRGLGVATLKHWRVGFNPVGQRIAGLFVPRGIVIPTIESASVGASPVVWSLKIRRAHGTPKYSQVAGGRPALYGARTVLGHSIAIVTEGEFDAMLVHQHVGDRYAVVTLGSASIRPSIRWISRLLSIRQMLVIYDRDAAGDRGAANWAAASARVSCAQVPLGKDLTDFVRAGGDVRAFLAFELQRSFDHTERPTPNSLPTPASAFSNFNSAPNLGAFPLEGGNNQQAGDRHA